MLSLQQIALGYLYPLLFDLAGIFGWDDATLNTIYNNVHDALDGTFWWLIAPPVALVVGVWLAAKNVVAAIPGWITDAAWFVDNLIKPIWGWVVTTINALGAWVNQAATEIWNIAVQVFNAGIKVFQDALNWVIVTLNAFGKQLTDLLQNFGARVTTLVTQFWNAITAPLKPWWNAFQWLWSNFGAQLTAFVTNPFKYITDLITGWIQTILAPFRPLLDFLAWWTNVGAPFLTALVNNPIKVILDLIAPGFIQWALDRIAEKW